MRPSRQEDRPHECIGAQDGDCLLVVERGSPALIIGVEQDEDGRPRALHPYPHLFRRVVLDHGRSARWGGRQAGHCRLDHVHLAVQKVGPREQCGGLDLFGRTLRELRQVDTGLGWSRI